MEQKTAVEWLINEITLKKLGENKLFLNPIVIGNIVEKALEMEKQQIIFAYSAGYVGGRHSSEEIGSEYYEQTYKSK